MTQFIVSMETPCTTMYFIKCIVLLVLISLSRCKPPCPKAIEIYRGPVFKSGQSYSVKVNDELVLEESFLFSISTGKYVKKAACCCDLDSCKVTFTLDGKDTVFYVNPKFVNKFVVGSDYRRKHSIATNLNEDAWVAM